MSAVKGTESLRVWWDGAAYASDGSWERHNALTTESVSPWMLALVIFLGGLYMIDTLVAAAAVLKTHRHTHDSEHTDELGESEELGYEQEAVDHAPPMSLASTAVQKCGARAMSDGLSAVSIGLATPVLRGPCGPSTSNVSAPATPLLSWNATRVRVQARSGLEGPHPPPLATSLGS